MGLQGILSIRILKTCAISVCVLSVCVNRAARYQRDFNAGKNGTHTGAFTLQNTHLGVWFAWLPRLWEVVNLKCGCASRNLLTVRWTWQRRESFLPGAQLEVHWKLLTATSSPGNLKSSGCTVGLSSWSWSNEVYFLSSYQNISRIMLVIFLLVWVVSCLILTSMVKTAVLFWFPFWEMLDSCENVQKRFSTCFCFLVCSF